MNWGVSHELRKAWVCIGTTVYTQSHSASPLGIVFSRGLQILIATTRSLVYMTCCTSHTETAERGMYLSSTINYDIWGCIVEDTKERFANSFHLYAKKICIVKEARAICKITFSWRELVPSVFGQPKTFILLFFKRFQRRGRPVSGTVLLTVRSMVITTTTAMQLGVIFAALQSGWDQFCRWLLQADEKLVRICG